jgi:hypothetical protein
VYPPDDNNPGPTHIGYNGPAEGFVRLVQERAGRHIELPTARAAERITIDSEGGWDAAIAAAGLEEDHGPLIDTGRVGGDPPIMG